MKAKELIPILQLNPEAEVLLSTVDYYEKTYQDAGYERGSNQAIESVSLNKKTGIIYLEGGEEFRRNSDEFKNTTEEKSRSRD